MYKKDIEKFINENSDEAFFTGGIDHIKISDIEKQLCIKFQESYKWFLSKYGFGGIFGVEILGCGKAGVASVIRETERYRKLGLPLDYVVISNSDEWVYCLDLKDGDKYDCKIISWDRIIGVRKIEAESFYEFILQEFKYGKDSWDEEF